MRGLLYAMALALTLMVSQHAQAATSANLVGRWLMMQDGSEFPASCDSSEPIGYNRNGTSDVYDEKWKWTLRGNLLTETKIKASSQDESGSDDIGKPYKSSLRWTGKDAFIKTFADGKAHLFRRCPPRG